MSLNGLDAAKVNEAYEGAIADTGGWLLLNYISRDEVDVYKTGTGGSSEVKEAISQYEEKSPLYGLLVYRRKKVLLKYVPEGTSRLLQARLAVHMQSVVEKFPHDALLPLETAAALTDTKLSSSISALKTSNSVKSMNSLKRRRLTEIAEDAGETAGLDNSETPGSEIADPLTVSDDQEQLQDQDDNASTSTTKAVQDLDDNLLIHEPNPKPFIPTSSIETGSRPTIESSKTEFDSENRPSLALSESDRSITSKSLHNGFSPSSDAYAYLYKPKVKLAPRPVAESRHSNPGVRPTSTLPAGIQLQSRSSPPMISPTRTQVFPKPPNVPQESNHAHLNGFGSASVYNDSTYDDRPVSRGSIATVPANIRYVEEEFALTPEKKRLMKALQKRKQQQKARQLAKEGKFEDDDMNHENDRGSGINSTKEAQSAISTRSSSPKKLQKRTPKQPVNPEPPVSNSDPQISSGLPPTAVTVEPTITDAERPSSTIKIVSSSLDDQPPLVKDESQVQKEPIAAVNGLLKSPFAGNDTGESPQRPLPPSSPAQTLDIIPDQIYGVNETNNIVDEGLQQELIGQAITIDRPLTPESVDLDLPIEGQALDDPSDETTPTDVKPVAEEVQTSTSDPVKDVHISEGISREIEGPLGAEHEVMVTKAPVITHPEPEPVQNIDNSVHDSQVVDNIMQQEPLQIPIASETKRSSTPLTQILRNTSPDHDPNRNSISNLTVLASPEQSTNLETEIQAPNEVASAEVRDSGLDKEDSNRDEPNLSKESHHIERRSKPPPINSTRNSAASHSKAASLSEEDSLFEELQSATMEEATPVVLARTPTTPFTPSLSRQLEAGHESEASGKGSPGFGDNSGSAPALPSIMPNLSTTPSQTSQSVSEAGYDRTETPDVLGSLSRPDTRDASLSHSNSFGNAMTRSRQSSLSPTNELERPSSRKSTVSSLISQRIKAFEDKFGTTNSSQQKPTSAVKAQIVTLRKVSLNTPPPSGNATLQSQSGRSTPSPYPTPSPSPHHFVQRFGFSKTPKKESGPQEQTPKDKAPKDMVLKLNEGVTDTFPVNVILPEGSLTPPETKSRRSFFSSSKSHKRTANSVSSTTSFKKEGRLSPDPISTHGNTPPGTSSSDSIGRSRSPSSVESLTSDGEKKDSKKKAGLLKRFSGIGSNTRRTIAETMNEQSNEQSVKAKKAPEPEPANKWRSSVVFGDLNIQFPDTLLWKRRHVEVDSQGFLVLSPSQSDKNSKVSMKRYHMADFRKPYIPEPDREELPYSVNLDFLDGSTIQCACDSSTGQQRVWQALTAARDAFVTM